MKLQCIEISTRRTGHNDDTECVYSFTREIVFGQREAGIVGMVQIQSKWTGLYELGKLYDLELKP